jgi:hypothetical protein
MEAMYRIHERQGASTQVGEMGIGQEINWIKFERIY